MPIHPEMNSIVRENLWAIVKPRMEELYENARVQLWAYDKYEALLAELKRRETPHVLLRPPYVKE